MQHHQRLTAAAAAVTWRLGASAAMAA